jgi:hypothetical protein
MIANLQLSTISANKIEILVMGPDCRLTPVETGRLIAGLKMTLNLKSGNS